VIRYLFDFGADDRIQFEVERDSDTSVETESDPVPEWIALDRHRCDRCEIPPGSRRTCPAALSLKPVVEAFGSRISYENVRMTAELNGFTLSGTLPTQRALRALAGLVLALSSCPVMRKLRPMAHFHLPFGTREQTTFRFLGTHLVAQYLRERQGLPPDWSLDGLRDLVADLHMVNIGLADRIRMVAELDAPANSVALLDTFASAVELSLEQDFDRLQPLFAAYFTGQGSGSPAVEPGSGDRD
jgi:hypothetical protein